MGDAGPTIAHSGKALLRQMVSKSPKPIVPLIVRVLDDEVSFAMKRGGKQYSRVKRLRNPDSQAVKESVVLSE